MVSPEVQTMGEFRLGKHSDGTCKLQVVSEACLRASLSSGAFLPKRGVSWRSLSCSDAACLDGRPTACMAKVAKRYVRAS